MNTQASAVVQREIFLQHILFFRKCPPSHVTCVNGRPQPQNICCATRGKCTTRRCPRRSCTAPRTVTSPTLRREGINCCATGRREKHAPGKAINLEFTLVDFHFSRGLLLNCPHCGKNLHRPKKLANHLVRNGCPSQYSCDICDMKFRLPSEVLQHKREQHEM